MRDFFVLKANKMTADSCDQMVAPNEQAGYCLVLEDI